MAAGTDRRRDAVDGGPLKLMNEKRLKVAFITFDWPEYSMRLAHALSAHAEVMLLAPGPWRNHVHHFDGDVTFVPFRKPRFRQLLHQFLMARRITRAVHRFGPDVVHLQHGHPWFNLFLGRLKKYPLVVTIHDPSFHPGDAESQRLPQRFYDIAFNRADEAIVHTSQIKAIAIQEKGLSADRLSVIPHVQLGDPTMRAEVAEIPGTVLFFGRIWPYKGLEYLIKAEPLIAAEVSDFRIVIAGRGESFDRYRAMMQDSDRFVVHNEHISDSDRAALFRESSVVVLPYIEASQSGVVPVAYTFSKPVIATRVGGLPEQVTDGETGLLVPPQDTPALAAAIVRLLQDAPLRHSMGQNGHTKLISEWSAESVARQTLPVYTRARSHHTRG